MQVPDFAAGETIWDLFWREKWLNICGGGGRWCQVTNGILGALGLIEELKSSLVEGTCRSLISTVSLKQ